MVIGWSAHEGHGVVYTRTCNYENYVMKNIMFNNINTNSNTKFKYPVVTTVLVI